MNNLKHIDMELALIRAALVGETDSQLVERLTIRLNALEKERDYILYQDAAQPDSQND